jgi:alkylhydroperoxidase family enzyme
MATPAVPLIEREDVVGEAAVTYDRVAATRGRMGNVFKALANSPGALDRVAALGEFVRFESGLGDELREALILTVAAERSCVYEWTHHWHLAERAGMSAERLAVMGTGAAEDEPAPIGPAVRLARSIARTGDAPAELVGDLRNRLGDRALVELVATVGYYTLLAGVINSLDVPLEEDVEPIELPDGRTAT